VYLITCGVQVCTKCHERNLIFGPSSVPYKPQAVQLKSGLVFWKMTHCIHKKGDGIQYCSGDKIKKRDRPRHVAHMGDTRHVHGVTGGTDQTSGECSLC